MIIPEAETVTVTETRQSIKYINHFVILLWRLGLGGFLNFGRRLFPARAPHLMVISHSGRKSGRVYRTPLIYSEHQGEIYAASGFGSSSDWYKNILRNPQVEIWMPDGWWVGTAEDVSTAPDALSVFKHLLNTDPIAAKTSGLDPETAEDKDIKEFMKTCRLVHIRRVSPRTGEGGPGDLSWIWPMTTFILLFTQLFRPRRRR